MNAAGPALDDVCSRAGVGRPRMPLLHAAEPGPRAAVVTTHAVGARSGGRFLFLVPWRGRAIVGTAYDASAPAAGAGGSWSRRSAPSPGRARAADVTLVHRGRVPGRDAAPRSSRSRVLDHEKDGRAGRAPVAVSA